MSPCPGSGQHFLGWTLERWPLLACHVLRASRNAEGSFQSPAQEVCDPLREANHLERAAHVTSARPRERLQRFRDVRAGGADRSVDAPISLPTSLLHKQRAAPPQCRTVFN